MANFNLITSTGTLLLVLYTTTYDALFDLIIYKTNEKYGLNRIKESIRSAGIRYALPKLFNFERFKRLFKRSYESMMEEALRKKIFLAKALRAFVSAVKYKFSFSSSYLAINGKSDRTPDEVKQIFMHISRDIDQSKLNSLQGSGNIRSLEEQDIIPAVNENDLKEEFNEVAGHQDKPGFREIIS